MPALALEKYTSSEAVPGQEIASSEFQLKQGHFSSFLDQKSYYSVELRACILETVQKLITVSSSSEAPGMLLGKIQSGKTRTFIGAIAVAFDNGFDVCVVLTKGTRALAKQTFERIDQDFRSFVDSQEIAVYDILNLPTLSKRMFEKS
jgi:hypothetical protein